MIFRLSIILFLIALSNTSRSQDSTSYLIVNEIKLIGNKTTKDHIIIRELPFNLGDTILVDELNKTIERTQSNIFNTSLFNFVTVEIVYFNETYISVYITVEERWYWWPLPIFEIEETNFNTWWQTRNLDRASYGLYVAKENFRGRKERIAFKAQGGYTEMAGFNYSIPYVNKKQTQGLSVGLSYSRNHEINYSTLDNKRLFYKNTESFVYKEIYAKGTYEFRPKLYNNHSIQLSYSKIDVSDSVVFYNDNYLSNKLSSISFLSLTYYLKRDKRNNKAYPVKGYFYDFQFTQNGLGLLNTEVSNSFILFGYRKFIPLNNKLYWAGATRFKTNLTQTPFYFMGGLGYGNHLVRGYEYYVINGNHFALGKTQLRYALLDNKVFKFNLIPLEKFNKIPLSIFSGVFFDGGYVSENREKHPNFLNEKWLFGGGVSLDLVSYYDIVFRFEYSFNNLNENGLFIHFVAPL
ncbi:MAG: hypothetical protein IT232_03575 [Flavobacteriales bacterium]|nr:hypothetical protein [Flavobacteriales bacterium]